MARAVGRLLPVLRAGSVGGHHPPHVGAHHGRGLAGFCDRGRAQGHGCHRHGELHPAREHVDARARVLSRRPLCRSGRARGSGFPSSSGRSSPPTRWPCYYGIDTPTRAELDLNGVVGATISTFTADGRRVSNNAETAGAGIQITDSADVTLTGAVSLAGGATCLRWACYLTRHSGRSSPAMPSSTSAYSRASWPSHGWCLT